MVALTLLIVVSQLAPAHAWVEDSAGASSTSGGGQYEVARWTIDGGGGKSSGGTYAISGTVAQPDSDPLQPSTGANFAITGGFWPGLTRSNSELFADGFEAQ